MKFPYLPPGKYYARIYEDHNGNGLYDTGNLDSLLQPDMAYYYPKVINIKKNWEKAETWSVFDMAIDLMKPENLKRTNRKPTSATEAKSAPRKKRRAKRTIISTRHAILSTPTTEAGDATQAPTDKSKARDTLKCSRALLSL